MTMLKGHLEKEGVDCTQLAQNRVQW